MKLSIALIVALIPLLIGCVRSVEKLGQLRENNELYDLGWLNCNNFVPECPLSLDDIVDLALQRDLDLLVKDFEASIQEEAAYGARFRMIPPLIYNWEHSIRNKSTGTSSKSLVAGVPPAPLSVSVQKHVNRFDYTLAWNLLDFGLSYYRARQEANRGLMQFLEYERLRQNLVLDVSREYWTAIAARRATEVAKDLSGSIASEQELLNKHYEMEIISEMPKLKNESQLINVKLQLQGSEKDYHHAISQLGLHMALLPGTPFELERVNNFSDEVDLGPVEELAELALRNRPELFSIDVDQMVRLDEVKAAFLQMFPGFSLFESRFHDTNIFFLFKYWCVAGLRATWNLFDLPHAGINYRVAKRGVILSHMNRLALSMGVVSQVYLAYLNFLDIRQEYILARDLFFIKARQVEVNKNEILNGYSNELEHVFYESDAFLAEIAALEVYRDMQVALEQLNNATGIPQLYRTHQ